MALIPSLASDLFDRIQSPPDGTSPYEYIKAFVNQLEPTFESEFLDFKSGCRGHDGVSIDDSDVKKIWSEAICAFANTGGGVIVWGINARKTATPSGSRIDAACGVLEVPDVHALRSRLQELAHQASDPPVLGIRIEAYSEAIGSPRGFVVCLIPESDHKPHRAELAQRRWLIRIVDSFVDAPVSVLRSLFFPRRQTRIEVEVAFKPPRVRAEGNLFDFRIGLKNTGTSTAEDVLFAVEQIDSLEIELPYRWTKQQQKSTWLVRLPLSIHPGEQADGIVLRLRGDSGVFPLFKMRTFSKDQVPSEYELQMNPNLESPVLAFPRPLDFAKHS